MRTNLLKLIVLSLAIFVSMGFSMQETPPKSRKFVVVLDAGHGGKDPGNRGNGYFEKNIALNIVLKAGAMLEKLHDVEVIYTRKTDVFLELWERPQIANKANADLFISVHCNAHNSQASGTETFVLGLHKSQANFEVAKKENSVIYLEEDYETTYGGFDPNSPESYIGLMLMQEQYLDQSIRLASLVQNNFTNNLKRKNRGVKQAGFWVLKDAVMPSVLVETGFLTNKEEGSYLNAASGQDQMANAIVEAVLNYKKTINLESFEDMVNAMPEVHDVSTVENFSDKYKGIEFKVQVAATSKKVEPTPSNFKGLKPVTYSKEGKLYKYYYGSTDSYLKVQQLQKEAQDKGFPSSFIVAYKEGRKVSVNDALKSKVN